MRIEFISGCYIFKQNILSRGFMLQINLKKGMQCPNNRNSWTVHSSILLNKTRTTNHRPNAAAFYGIGSASTRVIQRTDNSLRLLFLFKTRAKLASLVEIRKPGSPSTNRVFKIAFGEQERILRPPKPRSALCYAYEPRRLYGRVIRR